MSHVKFKVKKIPCRGRGTGKVCVYKVFFFANYNGKEIEISFFLASFFILYYYYYLLFCLSLIIIIIFFLQGVGTNLQLPDLTGTR